MKKLMMITMLFALPLAVQACGMGEVTPEGYENADIEHAHQHWEQGDKSAIPFQFLDVRTVKEYQSGHVPGAINIPIQELAKRIKEVPTDKQVYVYCESGTRSAKAAKLLAKSGYSRIENMGVGMSGWRDHGFPQE
ncbi:MAG: rhodanese-like domain-containing protein [Mariprofundaceae bacterium]|nr:rhodanese-like domain-containing protein [Mariprofundaceae bacterium]